MHPIRGGPGGQKDRVENHLAGKVRRGDMTLPGAQQPIPALAVLLQFRATKLGRGLRTQSLSTLSGNSAVNRRILVLSVHRLTFPTARWKHVVDLTTPFVR